MNTPVTFQAYINQALVSLVNIIYIVYLDDILVFLEDLTEYTIAIYIVLERLRIYKLYINLKKYKFNTNIVEFLGFIVGLKGISIDPSRVKTIQG